MNVIPDALLDRIDGLQTQVTTAETEVETARTGAWEAARDVLRKAGEAELRARRLWRASGSMAAGATFGLGRAGE
jgi:hypothetical protein